MSSRREQIEAMLADEPQDTFLRYALAMELRKEGDLGASVEKLGELIEETPPHIPAYLMSAQQLAELDRVPEARSILRVGIEEARKQGDAHAASEMGELLAHLGSA